MFNHILKKMLKLAGDASAFAIFVGFFFSSRGWGDNWLKQMKNTGASHMGFELWCDLCLPPKHSRSYTCVICKRFCLMSLLEFCLGWAFPLWLLQGVHLQSLGGKLCACVQFPENHSPWLWKSQQAVPCPAGCYPDLGIWVNDQYLFLTPPWFFGTEHLEGHKQFPGFNVKD